MFPLPPPPFLEKVCVKQRCLKLHNFGNTKDFLEISVYSNIFFYGGGGVGTHLYSGKEGAC